MSFHIKPNMVFPSTKMNSVNKLITEGSLTRLINNLIDTDSYIIPPAGVDLSNYTDEYGSTMIKLEDINKDIEFVIKGYYFNLGDINNILSGAGNLSANTNYMLSAEIFIDTAVENYPELDGEESISHNYVGTYESGLTLENLQLDDYADSIKSIIIKQGTNEWQGTLNDNGVIVPVIESTQSNPTGGTVTITYYDYSSIINLTLTEFGNTIPAPTETTGITGKKSYSMNLAYIKTKPNVTEVSSVFLPLNSFHKLNHYSISSIDGGEI